MTLKSAFLTAILALPAVAAASHSQPSESATVHHRSTVWAMVEPGAHVGDTFALMVFSGDDSDTLDYGMTWENCATKRMILSHDMPNEFACRVEQSI